MHKNDEAEIEFSSNSAAKVKAIRFPEVLLHERLVLEHYEMDLSKNHCY